MYKYRVVIDNKQKDVKIPKGIRILMRRCCNAVLSSEGIKESVEVSINFVNDADIKELNKKYRGKDIETDVLAFPLGEKGNWARNPANGAIMLGDIVISIERAVSQAKQYNHTLQREIAYLTVHAMLHLLGYDHEKGGIEAIRMREKEEGVLALLGLQRDISYSYD